MIKKSKNKVYIIAEAGVAHFGSLLRGKELINLAKKSGADAVKFQSYITEELIDKKYKKWFKRYKIKEVNYNFLKKLRDYSKKKKIDFLCTPHSETALSWVNKLKVPIIKVGSGELGNFEFLKRIIKLKKPMIVSTGMHNLNDLKKLSSFFQINNYKNVSFLRCITRYPTKNNEVNLSSFKLFKKIFKKYEVGYSDHSDNELGILGSIVLGAKIVEKHIATKFNVPNTQDWKVSYDLKKMKSLVKKIRDLEIVLGDEKITISKKEKNSKDWATKSIFLRRNINKGNIIKKNDLSCKRPGIYVPASELKRIINKKAKKNLREGNPLKLNDF
ncbi:N-acetylneuraminate synthase family protein [Candidatus Pelagibacter bacterium]|nr:N-acetylneuraminate synthase family protein [Candidatus Pelagibacter bacterium]